MGAPMAFKSEASLSCLPAESPSGGAVEAPITKGKNLVGEECPICLEKVKDKTAFLHTCEHVFCFDCIMTWVKIKSICPMCKKQLKSIICFEGERCQEISIKRRKDRKFPLMLRLVRLFERHLGFH
ncbi:hypothetical protein Mapa_011850 [Marchantia paleacea]|nr:hypothetical protein Mapa_011850 [Marchantia paleacea]